MKRQRCLLLTLTVVLLMTWASGASAYAGVGRGPAPAASLQADDASAPSSPVKLVFIHHSTGQNWLADGNGGLGIELRDNNYFVSDTNYGWGPSSIGDTTDIGHWWNWFRGASAATYLSALYGESGKHSTYSRLPSNPGGENEVIMFKSCFPNSYLGGLGSDSATAGSNPLRGQGAYSAHMTVANAKGIYNDILTYFGTRQDKLFVVIAAPPQVQNDTDASHAANARAFNNWLVNDWLDGYAYDNVALFDFYSVLTSNVGNTNTNDLGQATGNHHRWRDGAVQHVKTVNNNYSAYGSGAWDSHPSSAGNLKATAEFVPLLNVFYNRWKGGGSTGVQVALPLGWSLASLPIEPNNSAIATVLQSIAGQYNGVMARENPWSETWLWYEPGNGGSCLATLDSTRAFWIEVTEATTLTVEGAAPGTTVIAMHTGWNLVPYPSGQSRSVSQALSSIAGSYDLVYGYEAGDPGRWLRYSPTVAAWGNSLTQFVPGGGYWVRATANCSLTIQS